MERKEILLLLVFSCVYLKCFVQAKKCDPKPLIKQHEGYKRCVYLDKSKKRTIGYGFNMEKDSAREEFIKAGQRGHCQCIAEKVFDMFLKSPLTKHDKTCPCCCCKYSETSKYSCVPCLDGEYIQRLLDSSLKTAIDDAEVVIGDSTFNALCCPVQNAIVSMAYNLGRTKFKDFVKLKAAIEKGDWDKAACEAKNSIWCGQVKTRCTDISKIIGAGC